MPWLVTLIGCLSDSLTLISYIVAKLYNSWLKWQVNSVAPKRYRSNNKNFVFVPSSAVESGTYDRHTAYINTCTYLLRGYSCLVGWSTIKETPFPRAYPISRVGIRSSTLTDPITNNTLRKFRLVPAERRRRESRIHEMTQNWGWDVGGPL